MAFNTTTIHADAFLITPNTNGTTRFTAHGFYVGGTSGTVKNVNVITSRGNTVLFTGIPAGKSIPLIICGVRTTNTTASASLVGYGPS